MRPPVMKTRGAGDPPVCRQFPISLEICGAGKLAGLLNKLLAVIQQLRLGIAVAASGL